MWRIMVDLICQKAYELLMSVCVLNDISIVSILNSSMRCRLVDSR